MKRVNMTNMQLPMLMRTSLLPAILVAAVLLGGCGGIGPEVPDEAKAAIVVVDAVDADTKELLKIEATAVCGGVKGTISVQEGSVVLRNVPFGSGTPPTQPLTVSAPGYVTYAEAITLSTTVVTFYTATMRPADLDKTGTVKGKITDSDTGRPIGSALVKFIQMDAGGTREVRGYTDNNGQYIIGGIPIGSNVVSAEREGYMNAETRVNVVQDSSGENADVDLQLLPGTTTVTVSGTIRDAFTQVLLEGAEVTIGSRPPVLSDANGEFTVTDVSVGSQRLTVSLDKYDLIDQVIQVLPGMGRLRLGMTPAAPDPPGTPYNLAGTVTLVGPDDSAGAEVSAVDIQTAREMARVITPASGEYYMFVPPGEYRLTVTYGSRTITRTVTVPGGGRVLEGVDFVLTAS